MIDRTTPISVDVSDGGWRIVSQTPDRGENGTSMPVRIKLEPVGSASAAPPEKIIAEVAGQKLEMTAGAGRTYTASWTPSKAGKQTIAFTPVGGLNVEPATAQVEIGERSANAPPAPNTTASAGGSTLIPPVAPPSAVPPDFRLGRPRPIRLKSMRSGKTGESNLVFDDHHISQDSEVQISTDLDLDGSVLEIQTPSGWQVLGKTPLTLRLPANQTPNWAVRMRVEACPEACAASENHQISILAARATGGTDQIPVPLQVEVIPDPWLPCHWKYLAAAAAAMLTIFVAFGYIWPERFGARIGAQLSPEVDLGEGFFYPLRTQSAAKIGFYRHARLYLSPDFRLTGKSSGSLAKLRAGKKRTYIQPLAGQTLWRQRLDGEWDRLPSEEIVARENTIYRNDDSSLFFDLRMK